MHGDRFPGHLGQRLLQRSLHRGRVLEPLPAAIMGTVVLDAERQTTLQGSTFIEVVKKGHTTC